MEKLVELLNEYSKYVTNGEIGWKKWEYDEEFGNLLYGDYNGGTFSEMYCISKRYGFIERLVENDKISFVKKNEDGLEFNWQIMDDCMDTFDAYPVDMDTGELSDDCTDMLIMILSIQDNPIEYLCSILK